MTDFYDILGLDRSDNPSDRDIQKAYHRKAMKFHPDRMKGVNSDKKDVAERKFKAISEAYQVLSDPKRKGIYDQYGEDGLRVEQQGGNPEFSGQGAGIPAFFQTSGGSRSPFGGFASVSINGVPMFGSGGGGLDEFFSGMGSNGFEFGARPQPKPRPTITQQIYLTLAELSQGCTKKYRVTYSSEHTKTYQVKVKPGWKEGTKVTYRETYGTVTFVVMEKPHPTFKRVGHNLHWPVQITPSQAEKRLKLTTTTVDGRSLTIETESARDEPVHTVVGEGMPKSRDTGKGNLVITFNIKE